MSECSIEYNLVLLICLQDHTEFHQDPLTTADLAAGFTRPYRWHMDAPLYEKLPGQVTTLHCLEIPELPDQNLRFADSSTMNVAAGATACTRT